ncbi:MAG: hypothetical protein GX422_05380 [Deltaproteobacteria bacterium]|nr:hypothetical protein [Deltaproteobacteria bacterium]
MSGTDPFLLGSDGVAQHGTRLPRVHDRFDERFIQELLVTHPELLPVAQFRPDIGEPVCIGREVPTRDSGTIDNLYLSTARYVVVVETKLWRNPQSRREVVSQVLDYVKDIVTRDFDWLESVWRQFANARGHAPQTLIELMRQASDGELDEGQFVDRVQRGIGHGDVIALIVGDGIESQLQQLVSHLCRDSAHLRYSIGLISLRCYQMPVRDEMLVLPELVQEVEPVQRAYVRIELDEALAGQARIASVVETHDSGHPVPKRITLTEEELYDGLVKAVGQGDTDCVRRFIAEVCELGIESDFKSAAVMLKLPDPGGESREASLLAIERSGRVYNPDHGKRQALRWGWSEAAVDRTIGAYWRKLNALDSRFSISGMSHQRRISWRMELLRPSQKRFRVKYFCYRLFLNAS